MKKRTLKEIALELLEMYEFSESERINEYSISIDDDLSELRNIIAQYRKEIEE